MLALNSEQTAKGGGPKTKAWTKTRRQVEMTSFLASTGWDVVSLIGMSKASQGVWMDWRNHLLGNIGPLGGVAKRKRKQVLTMTLCPGTESARRYQVHVQLETHLCVANWCILPMDFQKINLKWGKMWLTLWCDRFFPSFSMSTGGPRYQNTIFCGRQAPRRTGRKFWKSSIHSCDPCAARNLGKPIIRSLHVHSREGGFTLVLMRSWGKFH